YPPCLDRSRDEWWRELDLNQRRLSQRIYSPSPLTTRASLQSVRIKRPSIPTAGWKPRGLGRVYAEPSPSCQHGASNIFDTFSKHPDDRAPSQVYESNMSKDPKDGRTAKDTHYANLRRAHRDQKRERGELPAQPSGAGKAKAPWKAPQLPAETVWLYGIHTVKAAIDNPERKLLKLRVTRNALARLELNDAQ